MKTFGIDISRWQGNFNLKAAMEEGVKFAVIKGGGGGQPGFAQAGGKDKDGIKEAELKLRELLGL